MNFFARPSIGRIRLRSAILLGTLWFALGVAGIYANGGKGEIRSLPSAVLFSVAGFLVLGFGISLIFSERFRNFMLVEQSEEDELVTASAFISLIGGILFLGGLKYVYRFAA